ncbi:ATP-binding protein [Sorangium sp. So ce426]|uniref:ATP-binding protein n=1 Tax=Sorangium sp. So ce426 TaxID=3133312 RepID=UPI003F5B7040
MPLSPVEHRPPMRPAAPFASSLEHLRAELDRIALLLRIAVARPAPPGGGARGPALSPEEELFALLDRGVRPGSAAPPHLTPALAEAEAAADAMAADIARRCEESARRGVPLRLAELAERFALSRLDIDLLLLALLAELDRDAARLLALVDPDGGGQATAGAAVECLGPALEARLAARARLSPRAPLLRHELVHLRADPSAPRASLLAHAVVVDERIAAYLHGDDQLDARLAPHARLDEPRARLDDLLLPAALKEGLARFVTAQGGAGGPIVYLQGPYGAGKRATAEALCRLLGARLVAVDCAGLLAAGEPDLARAARLAAREARLAGAALHLVAADAALDEARPAARAALLATIAAHDGPVFLSGDAPFEPAGALRGRAFVRAELPRPGAAEQAELWSRALGERRAPDVDLEALTGAFRLTGGQIRDAADAARSLARLRGAADGPVSMADVTAACRLRHGRKLAALARRIPPQFGWDDLVLPPDRKAALREVCLQLKHRSRVLGAWGFERKLGPGRPLSALFSGPPGTGKTMAAGVIAGELGVELFHIDLSRVVSKYIGETEKHLAELFADAEAANAALFFDEADALFGKRTEVRDAHDRYANQETSYLLQRVDAYEGVVLLATNLVKNVDEAFVRRLGFVIEFPAPGPAERLKIWQKIWPAEAPLAPDVDLAFLADRIDLSGGYIRNVALAASFLAAEEGAPIGMRHLVHAARREYQKMGKVVDAGRLVLPASREPR